MNDHDMTEVRKVAPVVAAASENTPPRYDEVYWDAMEKMAAEQESNYIEQTDFRTVLLNHRIHIRQLSERIAELEASKVVPWRLVTKCIIGCFLGSVTGMLLASWLR